MFSSIDSVDIVLKPQADGRQQFVQTDHRAAAEIEQDPQLAAAMALIRILNAKQAAGQGAPEPIVIYAMQSQPPEWLVSAIQAAGGTLVVGDDVQSTSNAAAVPPLDTTVESAFANLARATTAEYGVPLTLEGLATLEHALAETAGSVEVDEIAYWSAVVRLGVFGGELIRQSSGGRWIIVDSGTLPLALTTRFHGEEATVNPLGKAIKRFTNGEADSLVGLVKMLRSM